jgi:manganese oxidase
MRKNSIKKQKTTMSANDANTAELPGAPQAHNLDLSRRTLLKGAAVVGGSLAAVGGVALASQKATTQAASNSQIRGTNSGHLREYWIQVDSFFHNLVPTGYDGMMGMHFQASKTSYWAIGYRAYTPGWEKPLSGNDWIGANTGIPGPILRGEVGDTIRVHFRNNDTHYNFHHSMHPHGVFYTPNNDGGWFAADPRPGTNIAVGQSYTYEWQVRTNSPGTWVYHDHSLPSGPDMLMEFNSELGMFGFLVLTDASVKPVDREFFTFLHDLYQADIAVLSQDFDCFNGYAYAGNTPTFTAKVGERIRWHIAALGKEFHVFHIHGHRWNTGGQFTDTHLLGPAIGASFEFVEDNPGQWLYHCHVTDHMMGGMTGFYIVEQ